MAKIKTLADLRRHLEDTDSSLLIDVLGGVLMVYRIKSIGGKTTYVRYLTSICDLDNFNENSLLFKLNPIKCLLWINL